MTNPKDPKPEKDDDELNLTMDGDNVDGDDFQQRPVPGSAARGIDDASKDDVTQHPKDK